MFMNRGMIEIQQQPGIKTIPNRTSIISGHNVGKVDF